MNRRSTIVISALILSASLSGRCAELRFSVIGVAPTQPELRVSRVMLTQVNQLEQVVGWTITRDGKGHKAHWAFLFQAGTIKPILGLDSSRPIVGVRPEDVNDSGHIVGDVKLPGSRYRPFLHRHGSVEFLDVNDAEHGFAMAINERGLVVGCIGDRPLQPPRKAVIWRDGQLEYLKTDEADSVATDVNAAGVVVGYAGNKAFVWREGKPECLGECAPPEGTQDFRFYASCINDGGFIVGGRQSLDGQRQQVLCWRNGVPDVLPSIPRADKRCGGVDVNKDGWIVGCSVQRELGHRACLWREREVWDLNRLLDESGAGWVLSAATSINDAGVICGVGTRNGEERGFVLMPH
jgi:uncharacterized membrane protein